MGPLCRNESPRRGIDRNALDAEVVAEFQKLRSLHGTLRERTTRGLATSETLAAIVQSMRRYEWLITGLSQLPPARVFAEPLTTNRLQQLFGSGGE
jgi:hypothetical protein